MKNKILKAVPFLLYILFLYFAFHQHEAGVIKEDSVGYLGTYFFWIIAAYVSLGVGIIVCYWKFKKSK